MPLLLASWWGSRANQPWRCNGLPLLLCWGSHFGSPVCVQCGCGVSLQIRASIHAMRERSVHRGARFYGDTRPSKLELHLAASGCKILVITAAETTNSVVALSPEIQPKIGLSWRSTPAREGHARRALCPRAPPRRRPRPRRSGTRRRPSPTGGCCGRA